jgi:hypothetical protein
MPGKAVGGGVNDPVRVAAGIDTVDVNPEKYTSSPGSLNDEL